MSRTTNRAKSHPNPGGRKYRRAPSVLCYWLGEELVFENYLHRTRVAADPQVCAILDFFGSPHSLRELIRDFTEYRPASLLRSIERLIRCRLLEPVGSGRAHSAQLLRWGQWNPAAGFFHLSTKDFAFEASSQESFANLRRLARAAPKPAAVKSYPHSVRFPLKPPGSSSEFCRTLLARRTWRKFSQRPVEIGALSTLLGLTFGVQGWVKVPRVGRMAVRTSPSGGCLHPIEAYVLARRVQGIPASGYHYNGEEHCLERLPGHKTANFSAYLNEQPWFSRAAFLVFLTAVFGRTQWKYDYPRAYRAILLEAGHLCQTFCLTATSLGLAPFCTIAFRDSKIESDLGLDGISESAIYALGAGIPPTNPRNAHLECLSNAAFLRSSLGK